MVDYSTKSWNF